MFNAFARLPDASTGQFDTIDALADAWVRDGAVVWADLESPTPEELAQLGGLAGADGAALEDCLHGEQRTHGSTNTKTTSSWSCTEPLVRNQMRNSTRASWRCSAASDF